jgi:uncharacterized membrane protein
MREKRKWLLLASTLLLIIIHIAGVIGLNSVYKELFLALTPANLLLSATLLIVNHKEFNTSFFLFFLISFVGGYLIEVAGVHTGLIFGNYSYGNSLGIKLYNVPLIIGLNWFILSYCAGVICNKIKSNPYIKSGVAAFLLVIIDVLIEKIAPEYDFWSWSGGVIPLQNYIAWFVISFLIILTFYKLNFEKTNKLAPSLFIIQLVFFTLLDMF